MISNQARGLAASLLTLATLQAQSGTGSQPALANGASSQASHFEPSNPLLTGWLHELMDRDSVKARACYETVQLKEENPKDPQRMLAFCRIFEIDAFLARPDRLTELRKTVRELGIERNFQQLPGAAPVRRSLEALAKALHEVDADPSASARVAELRKRVLNDVSEAGVIARPYLVRQLGTARPGARTGALAQLESLRQQHEDAKRKGDQAAMQSLQAQIDAHQAELQRFQPRREVLRTYALEIVRQRLQGKDERAARLEETLRQTESNGGPLRRFLRGQMEADPRIFAQRYLVKLENYLGSASDLTQEERATLVACRDRVRALLGQGQAAKARDLLWPLIPLIDRG